jgi:hypothetical protein
MLWDREHTLCQLPKSECPSCFEKKPDRLTARPEAAIDWKDPQERNQYLYKKAGGAERSAVARARLLARDPEYFKRYAIENRDKLRAATKRFNEKKKIERARESSQTEVRPNPRGPGK